MCGITAYLKKTDNKTDKNHDCFETLTQSLQALQNRGYDSCGVIDSKFKCLLRNVKGGATNDAVKQLISNKDKFPSDAIVGMAHTRWATSGKKTVENAHPHVSSDEKIAVIHNGIIENYQELKCELEKDGYTFKSETDTEIISNWLARELSEIKDVTPLDVLNALKNANEHLEGTWAITVCHKHLPESVFVARRGNPLLIGINKTNGLIMVSSEIAGFVNKVDKYTILEENSVLHLKVGFTSKDILKQNSNLKFQNVSKEIIELTPGDFSSFMAKEIYDQIDAIKGPCEWGKYYNDNNNIELKDIPELKQLSQLKEKLLETEEGFDVLLVGCGTSYHSGLSSRWFFDKYPFRTVRCVVASEFTTNDLPKGLNENHKNVIAIMISQSGETLDTYRALKIIKEAGVPTIALVNVVDSMIARECDYALYLHAGREVGVASTKAYVTQIIGLNLLATYLKSTNGDKISEDFKILSSQIKTLLKKWFPYSPHGTKDGKHLFVCPKPFFHIINAFDKSNHGFSLASGSLRATAYESSLKIKEVGRVFIQGYPTASLKHGPFSLIEEGVPILFSLQDGEEDVLRRTCSAIEEVHLRGALIYLVTDIQDYENDKVKEIIKIPHNKTFSSILNVIPFQIISYFLAGLRGLDCDRPINLAKCVTTD